MRVIVVGLGVQGHKRRRIAGADCIADVDPVNQEARYRTVEEVPLADFDSALVCTPDKPKRTVASTATPVRILLPWFLRLLPFTRIMPQIPHEYRS